MPTYGLYLSTLVHEFIGIYVRKLRIKNLWRKSTMEVILILLLCFIVINIWYKIIKEKLKENARKSKELYQKEIREQKVFVDFLNKKEKYMKSELWKAKRQKRLILDNHTCQICGYKGKGLEIHHESGYILIPNEPLTCLKTLCRECHQDQHDVFGYPKTYKDYETWNHPSEEFKTFEQQTKYWSERDRKQVREELDLHIKRLNL